MQRSEAINLLKQLQPFFEVVRLVNVFPHTCYVLNETGTDLVPQEKKCFDVWNRGGQCENCISNRTISLKTRSSKLEYIDNTIFSIVSNYVEIEGQAFSLELVSKTDIDTVFSGAYSSFVIKSIDDYNHQLYHDPLTNSYNRLYLNEHFLDILHNVAIAMIDLDHLKLINDSNGHKAGDAALSTIAKVIQSNIRSTDALIRMGGDEFLLIFNNIPYDIFSKKLNTITQQVRAMKLLEFPELTLSISIGGVYGNGTKNELLELADQSLYKAKQNRGSVFIAKHDF